MNKNEMQLEVVVIDSSGKRKRRVTILRSTADPSVISVQIDNSAITQNFDATIDWKIEGLRELLRESYPDNFAEIEALMEGEGAEVTEEVVGTIDRLIGVPVKLTEVVLLDTKLLKEP